MIVCVVDQDIERHTPEKFSHLLLVFAVFNHASAAQQLRKFRVTRAISHRP